MRPSVEDQATRLRDTPCGPSRPACWACDATIPPGTKPESVGWATRVFTRAGAISAHMMEMYCPECVKQWGVPADWTAAARGRGA